MDPRWGGPSGAERLACKRRNRGQGVILVKWEYQFACNDLDLGKMSLINHHIDLTDRIPFKEHYHWIPPHMYEDMKAHLQEMLNISAILKSYSSWASTVVLVWKKDRSLRFCIDLRKLNNQTVRDAYLLPWIKETPKSLQGSQWFSSLNLKSGYWQVEVAEHNRPLTTFTVGPLGFYKCVRMPLGLTNAPATFWQLMETCLGNLNLNSWITYLDDIVIFSKDPASHLKRIAAVLKNLEHAGFKLKPSKCKLFCQQTAYLGHTVSTQGVATDGKKTEVIEKWLIPTTIT